MKLWISRALLMVGLLLAGTAAAVTLSTDGHGQVLIYPYYTTNADQQSGIILSNSAAVPKAVKLVIRSGQFGDAKFALNVYLGPGDTWTGTLFHWGSGDSAGPALLSNDSTCTVPDLHADTLPTVPGGRHYLRPNVPVLGTPPPGLEPGNGDEGYVVAIEMGDLTGASAAAVDLDGLPGSEAPADCGKLVQAWQSGGYWSKDPSTDISAPTGGLTGSMTVMNVAQGRVFRIKPTALQDFRVAAMHTPPTQPVPDLGSALSDAKTGVASAYVRLGNKIIRSDYPADRAVDAVSAVLTARTLTSTFDFRPGIGARTDFVFSMPTKHFYVTGPGQVAAPFGRTRSPITSPLGTRCSIVPITGLSRLGTFAPLWYPHTLHDWRLDPAGGPNPCYATSVMALDPAVRPPTLLGTHLASQVPLLDQDTLGQVSFDMGDYGCASAAGCTSDQFKAVKAYVNLMRPDLQGRQYLGLPVIGFAATGYINASVGGSGFRREYTFASAFDRDPGCVQNDVVGGCE